MIMESYLKKRKIKKNYFIVISNIKTFSKKLCLTKFPTTKILPNLQGTRQRRGLDNVEYGILIISACLLWSGFPFEEFTEFYE